MKEMAETSRREEGDFVDLRFYVADRTARCLTAYASIAKIWEVSPQGKYRITVIDLLKISDLARSEHCRSDPVPCSPDHGESKGHRDAHGHKKSLKNST